MTDRFKEWFLETMRDPDGNYNHLPDWLEEDMRRAWDAALSVPAPGTGGAEVTESCGCAFRDLDVPCRNPECKICHHLPQAGDLGAVKALRILAPDQDMPSPIDRLRLHATDPDTFAFSEEDALNLVDVLNEAIAALVSSTPVGKMDGWQRLKDEAHDYRLALTKIVQRADPERLSPISYEAAQKAAKIATDALAKHGIEQVDWPEASAFPSSPQGGR